MIRVLDLCSIRVIEVRQKTTRCQPLCVKIPTLVACCSIKARLTEISIGFSIVFVSVLVFHRFGFQFGQQLKEIIIICIA